MRGRHSLLLIRQTRGDSSPRTINSRSVFPAILLTFEFAIALTRNQKQAGRQSNPVRQLEFSEFGRDPLRFRCRIDPDSIVERLDAVGDILCRYDPLRVYPPPVFFHSQTAEELPRGCAIPETAVTAHAGLEVIRPAETVPYVAAVV